VCLFDCIEWLRERLQQWQDEAAAAAAEAAALAAALEQQAQLGSGQRDDADDSSSSSTSSRHGSDDLEDWHTDPSLLQAPESGDKVRCNPARVWLGAQRVQWPPRHQQYR
jgi:hypothetical protein